MKSILPLSVNIVTNHLELITKTVGIAGSSIAAIKGLYSYATDQSLDRKATRQTRDLDSQVGYLGNLEDEEILILVPELAQHKVYLQDSIREQLQELQSIKNKISLRSIQKNEEPQGFHRWLLVYRPEGLSGIFIQSLYYAGLICVGLMVYILPYWRGSSFHDWILWVSVFATCVALTLYIRDVALRLKKHRQFYSDEFGSGSQLRP